MKDERKTRRQLISELAELRRRIAELERAEIERRRTEEALRIRDSAMVSSINALASADLEGNLTYVNPAFLKRWGYDDEEEVLGRPSVEFWQMEEKALNVIEVLRDRGSWLGELVAKRKDGSLFDVQLSASMITDEAGQSIRMMASFVDITERKWAEAALRRSERELTLRNEIANIFLAVPDEQMYGEALQVILKTMESECGVFGYIDQNGDLVCSSKTGEFWDQCQVPEKDIVFPREAWGDIWARALIGKKSLYSNEPLRVPEGHIPILRVVVVPITHQGEVIGILEVANKMTDYDQKDIQLLETIAASIAPILSARLERDRQERESKRVEETLRESESRLRSILSSMVDLVFVFDHEGRFIFYHCPSLDLLYMPPEKFIGKKHSEVMPPYVDRLFAKAFNKNKKGEVADYEYLLGVGGETRWYSVKLSPMLLDDEFAGSVAVIREITKQKRAEEPLKSAAFETLGALSRLVEANDPYTSGHSTTVTEVAIQIAQEMGLRDGQLDTLRIAGPLHDVGKVGIPSSVLNKPTGLTEAEWVMIRAHPQVSANVAQQVTAFQVAVPVIRHHHERWDGRGYPDGLQEGDIPLLARILAVADGFQAMTSERPYRRARSEEEALAELEKGAGTQWDPEVVKIFLKLRKPPAKQKSMDKRKRRK